MTAPLQTYTPDDIRAKKAELAAWELRLAEALEKHHNATSCNYDVAAITWANCREIVQHLRGQLQTMKRRVKYENAS